MKDLRKYGYKRIDVFEMQKYLAMEDYIIFAAEVLRLQKDDIISPVKSSGINGKNPPLYNRYNILEQKRDYSDFEDELKHKTSYKLNCEYYLKHLEQYEHDRCFVQKLSDFLNNKNRLLDIPVSENERSFQIWQREKYLKSEGGKKLLNNLSFPLENLNIYPTTEPLAYFSTHKNTPQKILILENMDTFYTLRKYLIDGNSEIFGENIATVIYGRGKDIWKTFNDFKVCMEAYLLNPDNEILYLGDIDYEGIFIYQQLKDNFMDSFCIYPFVSAYCYMLDKAANDKMDLPLSKPGQNKNIDETFFSHFDGSYVLKMKDLLVSGKYIPQEIISLGDLKGDKKYES